MIARKKLTLVEGATLLIKINHRNLFKEEYATVLDKAMLDRGYESVLVEFTEEEIVYNLVKWNYPF